MSSYTIDHNYGRSARKAGYKLKYCKSLGVFSKTAISLALVGYDLVIANSALREISRVTCVFLRAVWSRESIADTILSHVSPMLITISCFDISSTAFQKTELK